MPTSPAYTLTGSVYSPGGVADEGYVTIELINFGDFVPYVNGTCVIAETTVKAVCNSSGIFNVVLFGDDQITPSTTYYVITLYSSDGSSSNSSAYILTGSGDDLATLTPLVSVPGRPIAHPLLLQTNSVTNGTQTKFNLVNGTGTTVTDNGSGNIRVDVPGLSFKTNGTPLSGSGRTRACALYQTGEILLVQ